MKKFLGIILCCIPSLFLIIVYQEGGLVGLAIYFLYVVAAVFNLYMPILGYRLIKGKV